jgi:hypothetical protein
VLGQSAPLPVPYRPNASWCLTETAEETESETTTEEDEEVQVFAEFNAADAIAYVETVEAVERLVRLAGVEQQRDTPRVTVTRAIEKRIEEIRTQSSSTPSSQES